MATALEIAVSYIALGWAVTPVKHRGKRPSLTGWPTVDISAEDAPKYFNGKPMNTGVRLGNPSNGLTDGDMDCREAEIAAAYFLPKTRCFGHGLSPASHWLFYSDVARIVDKAVIKFMDGPATILELRGGAVAAMTVFPGSTHESGEPIEWADQNEIVRIDGAELCGLMRRIAAVTILARHFPSVGSRHAAGLTVGGFLARCGFTAPEGKVFADALCAASEQTREKTADIMRAVADSIRDFEAGHEEVAGFPKLATTFGADVAKSCAEWLVFKADDPVREPPRNEEAPVRESDAVSGEGVRLEDFRAFMKTHTYIFMPTSETWPATSVNSRIPPVPLFDKAGNRVVDSNGNPKSASASAWLDRHAPVEQTTWAPGLPRIIEDRLIDKGGWIMRKKVSIFNQYRPPVIEPGDSSKAWPWTDHVVKVYGEEAALRIIAWFAHRVQRPHEKINHAILLGGAPGVGKDSLIHPLKMAVGPWNFEEVSPQTVLGRFNGFVQSVVMRINEARDLGEVDRFKFYEHLKGMTAAPPDVLRVDEKFALPQYVLNCVSVLHTTNYKTNGIYLPSNDRRTYVTWTDLRLEDFLTVYWTDLWRFYNSGGCGHVAAYLREIDLSDFDPKEPPPKTAAFWAIVDANSAPEDAEMADALDALKRPDVLTLDDVAKVAQGDFFTWLTDRKSRRQVPHRMEACGYAPVRSEWASDGLWVVSGRRVVVYARQNLSAVEQVAAALRLVRARGAT